MNMNKDFKTGRNIVGKTCQQVTSMLSLSRNVSKNLFSNRDCSKKEFCGVGVKSCLCCGYSTEQARKDNVDDYVQPIF